MTSMARLCRLWMILATLAVALLLMPAHGRAAPRVPESVVLRLLRVVGSEAAVERASARIFTTEAESTIARGEWALLRRGAVTAPPALPPSARRRLFESTGGITFVAPEAMEAASEARVRTLFVEGDIGVAGTLRRHRTVVLADDAFTARELAEGETIIAEDERLLARAFALAPGKSYLLQRSDHLLSRLAQLDTRITEVRLFHDIPSSAAEFRAVHGPRARPPSDASLQALRARAAAMGEADRVTVVDLGAAEEKTAAETLLARLANSPADDLRIVMGHVDRGVVRFHDGSGILVGDLLAKPRMQVAGCNTAPHAVGATQAGIATTTELTYGEGLASADTSRRAVVAGTKQKPATLGSVVDAHAHANESSGELLTIGVAGVAAPIYILSKGDSRWLNATGSEPN